MLKVLIPTDFSDNAKKAIEYALMLFGTEASYTLLHGYEVPHSGASMLISIADILEKDAKQGLESEQARMLKAHPSLEGKVTVKAVMGSPAIAARKLTEAEDYDILVMGTKGASGLKEVLVGSVASNILSEVKIPVLAVPNDASLQMPSKILFAADDACIVAGKLPDRLVELSNRLDAEVLILNVVPSGELSHVGNSDSQKHRANGQFEGVKHSVHFVKSDDVNDGIVSFISENKVDMLAMINRRNDFFSNLFGTSNTKSMMMHTETPLFAFH
jgi:nucleotide-binding universal stress UspA family protein